MDSGAFLKEEFGLSVRQVCLLLKVSSSVFYYRLKPKDDDAIVEALRRLADENYQWGF